jgi:CheY-like chemotaxis protein
MMNNSETSQPVVLVIDDEREVLDEVTEVLSREKFACRCCTTSQEALAAALETPPDLILCDLSLHGESGPETCEQIRQQTGMSGVPVMFLSGAQLPDIIRRSHAAGGLYCLRKPFDPKVLVELIDQAIGVPGG